MGRVVPKKINSIFASIATTIHPYREEDNGYSNYLGK